LEIPARSKKTAGKAEASGAAKNLEIVPDFK
jgi:hypothetical protein